MPVNSLRTTTITYTGDVAGTQTEVASNSSSPGQIQLMTLSSGANTITVPTGGSVPTACTIVKPSGNTVTLLLKKVTGDQGILLHLTDPDTISLSSSVTSFCLTASGTLTGLRLIWS